MTGKTNTNIARIECWVKNTHLQLRIRVDRMAEGICEGLNKLSDFTILPDVSLLTCALPRGKKKHINLFSMSRMVCNSVGLKIRNGNKGVLSPNKNSSERGGIT